IYPPQSRILDASLRVAERIAGCIFDQGLARVPRTDDVGALIRARAYHPVYAEQRKWRRQGTISGHETLPMPRRPIHVLIEAADRILPALPRHISEATRQAARRDRHRDPHRV